MKYIALRAAELVRRKYIRMCEDFDNPRLSAETYPDEVSVCSGEYLPGLSYDCYMRNDCKESEGDGFVLIHGGAFVYGSRVLDKRFGMELAAFSHLPVFSIDYTLMPQAGLIQIIDEITKAMNFFASECRVSRIHTVGDSAGGYLAYLSALALRNTDIKEALGLESECGCEILSAGLICGCYEVGRNKFPGIFFDKRDRKDRSGLPGFVYDAASAGKSDRQLKVAIVTGEDDFLRKDNLRLKAALDEAGADPLLLDCPDVISGGVRMSMTHVFPIAHPDWPQGHEAIELITRNCRRCGSQEGFVAL